MISLVLIIEKDYMDDTTVPLTFLWRLDATREKKERNVAKGDEEGL